MSNSGMLAAVNPVLPRFLSTFPAYEVERQGTRLGYVSVAVTASDAPLEEITNMRYDGRYAVDVYREIILPKLTKPRKAYGGDP